jgi:penicillin-binding protein 1A
MSGFTVVDALAVASGLALFGLFASAHGGATLWRRRLFVVAFLAAALVVATLTLFYRPASWGPMIAGAFDGDWRDVAKFAAAALIGVAAGRRLRRALAARGARKTNAAIVASPRPPHDEPAANQDPATAPPREPPRASLWNRLPSLRRPWSAPVPRPFPEPVSREPVVMPAPPRASMWRRLRPAPRHGLVLPESALAPPARAVSLWRRFRPTSPARDARATQAGRTPPGVSPTGRPWGGARAILIAALAGLAGLLASFAAPPARAQAAEPVRPAPDVMRRTMLRTLVQGNQIVFESEAGRFVPRCRCGPKLAPGETPRMLVDVLVATEDKRFWDHYGIDPIGAARGLLRALSRRRAEGGSTITQQLVKNAMLTSERSLNRKRLEAQLALAVEAAMSKEEIVAAYLNQVVFGATQGRDLVGVRMAALHFFGREPRELTLGEAAGLVGMLKATTYNSPTLHPDHFEARRKVVLDLVAQSGKFSKAQIAAARKPLRPRGPRALDWPETRWFVEIAMAELKNRIPDFEPTASTRVAVPFVADRQNALEIGLPRGLARLGPALADAQLQAAVVALGHDGRLLAAMGGRDYAASQFNRALTMGRPAASTAKIFVYAAAVDAGVKPAPALLQAFARSDNETAEGLARSVGVAAVETMARRHGVASPYAIRDARNVALGANNVGVVELAGAMLPYVNDGLAVRPYATFGVWRDGEPVFWREPAAPARALSPRVVKAMRPLLRAVVSEGTAKGRVRASLQAAGKTGTGDDDRDGWFVGYTPRHVLGVWLGRDDDAPAPGLTGAAAAAVFDETAARLAAQSK